MRLAYHSLESTCPSLKSAHIVRVYLDSNILIRAGKPPGGALIDQLKALVEGNVINILTTDHTIMEVAKHHGAADWKHSQSLSSARFRRLVKIHTGVELDEVDAQQKYEEIVEDYRLECPGY